MKIAHVIFSLNTGGAEHMLIDIINKQTAHAGVELFIINNEVNPEVLGRLNKDIPCRIFKRRPGSKNPLPIVRVNAALWRGGFDVIHCHSLLVANLLLPSLRKKAVLTIHSNLSVRMDFSKYAHCFSISQAVRDNVQSYSGTMCHVVSNGVSFDAITARERMPLRKGDFRILQISRLQHEDKGQHIAIEAMGALKKKGINNIQIDFIGEGDSLAYLRRLAEEQGVSECVNFLGRRDRNYVYEHIKDYDLVVQPSINEGFGLTIVEAMAAKVPVLISAIEGPMEIIESGTYGFLFEKGSALDMADKISHIMRIEPAIMLFFVNKAFYYAREKFSIERTALEYLEQYPDRVPAGVIQERSVVFAGVRPEAKGGIASVLQVYKRHFSNSLFFASQAYTSTWLSTLVFPFVCLRFSWMLATRRDNRIVHLHGSSKGSFYRKYTLFLISKYLFARRVVYHMHSGGFPEFYAKAPKWVKARVQHFMRSTDALICLSESWKQYFLEHFIPKRIVVLHNTVDRVMPKDEKIRQQKMIFLFLGKIGEPKGTHDLLNAAEQLNATYPGRFEVWVAGDGAVQDFQVSVEGKGLNDVVFYKGWVSGDAKEALLRESQVFVLPSYHEGMPVSILEAMAWHMPVIATTVGAIPELVQDGHSGMLISPGDLPGLYQAMERFLLSPSLIDEMGQAGAQAVQEHFVFDHTRKKLGELYETLTNTAPAIAHHVMRTQLSNP